jgi:hypothetical protein
MYVCNKCLEVDWIFEGKCSRPFGPPHAHAKQAVRRGGGGSQILLWEIPCSGLLRMPWKGIALRINLYYSSSGVSRYTASFI